MPLEPKGTSQEGFRCWSIIQKVEQGGMQPSWISPAIFVEKSDGGCRRVINFKALNKQCSRDPNHTPDVLKLASQIPSGKDSKTDKLYFSVLDAWNGYHSIQLKKMPRGISGSPRSGEPTHTTWHHRDSSVVATTIRRKWTS